MRVALQRLSAAKDSPAAGVPQYAGKQKSLPVFRKALQKQPIKREIALMLAARLNHRQDHQV